MSDIVVFGGHMLRGFFFCFCIAQHGIFQDWSIWKTIYCFPPRCHYSCTPFVFVILAPPVATLIDSALLQKIRLYPCKTACFWSYQNHLRGRMAQKGCRYSKNLCNETFSTHPQIVSASSASPEDCASYWIFLSRISQRCHIISTSFREPEDRSDSALSYS